MKRSLTPAQLYALLALVVIGVPVAALLLLGVPGLALPSEWSAARANIDDGIYPSGVVVNVVSMVLLLGWLGSGWMLVSSLRRRAMAEDDVTEPDRGTGSDTGVEPDPGTGSNALPSAAVEEVADLFSMASADPIADDVVQERAPHEDERHDTVSDAEIVGQTPSPSADEPPMIVPVRAYYFARAEDTLRSISAQFLQTPTRWEELRALNVASPGVAGAGPDTVLPAGTSLALPGDPLPWGKPDPVYLWTLAEKFLFTAWGREPTPEEVVPFWRGLTSGSQLEAGDFAAPGLLSPPEPVGGAVAPPLPDLDPAPAHPSVRPPEPTYAQPPTADEPTPVTGEPALSPEPQPTPPRAYEPPPEPVAPPPAVEAPPAYQPPPAVEAPAAYQPPPAVEAPAAYQPPPAVEAPAAYQPPGTDEPPAAVEAPAAYQPPPAVEPPAAYQPPPAVEPPAAYQPPPAVEAPAAYQPPGADEPPPTVETPPIYEPPGADEPPPTVETPPIYEPPGAYQPPPEPVAPPPPVYEPPPTDEPPIYEPPAAVEAPPNYEPPAAYQLPAEPTPPPVYEPPPATYEPPPVYEPPAAPVGPPAYQPPVPAIHQPLPPEPSGIPGVDLGPIEPETSHVEAEAPPMPTFLPSLMGADDTAPAAEARAVSTSNRGLAGTAIGDAMMLFQLSRIRRRSGDRQAPPDPIEESLRQSARVDTLNLIEAAMRHLRAVTVGRLREKPAVLAVRVGTYGFEVLLSRAVEAPEGWQAASLGHVLELPRGVTIEDLDAVGQGPSLCPALVPVGDTVEGPLLLNIEEIGCLIVSGPGAPSVNLLNAVVGTLGTSPLAGDIRIIAVGMDAPAGLVGWEKVHSTSFDSPELDELLTTAQAGSGSSLDILVVGPGNDLLIQRAGQVAATPGARLAMVGATSSVAARWPWRIHVDETTTAVVHPIACTMAAAQAMAPSVSQLLSGIGDPALLDTRRL